MIIEFYRDQNKEELRNQTIEAYKKLHDLVSDFVDEPIYENWHPEKHDSLSDAWKIVNLLECFGYPGYSWDTVLYSFYVSPRTEDKNCIYGDGLSFPQAVCNCLIKFEKSINYDKNDIL